MKPSKKGRFRASLAIFLSVAKRDEARGPSLFAFRHLDLDTAAANDAAAKRSVAVTLTLV